MPEGNPSTWMNAEAAAQYLRLPSRKALYQAVRRGELPVHRFGRRLRFRQEELDRAILRIQTREFAP